MAWLCDYFFGGSQLTRNLILKWFGMTKNESRSLQKKQVDSSDWIDGHLQISIFLVVCA